MGNREVIICVLLPIALLYEAPCLDNDCYYHYCASPTNHECINVYTTSNQISYCRPSDADDTSKSGSCTCLLPGSNYCSDSDYGECLNYNNHPTFGVRSRSDGRCVELKPNQLRNVFGVATNRTICSAGQCPTTSGGCLQRLEDECVNIFLYYYNTAYLECITFNTSSDSYNEDKYASCTCLLPESNQCIMSNGSCSNISENSNYGIKGRSDRDRSCVELVSYQKNDEFGVTFFYIPCSAGQCATLEGCRPPLEDECTTTAEYLNITFLKCTKIIQLLNLETGDRIDLETGDWIVRNEKGICEHEAVEGASGPWAHCKFWNSISQVCKRCEDNTLLYPNDSSPTKCTLGNENNYSSMLGHIPGLPLFVVFATIILQ